MFSSKFRWGRAARRKLRFNWTKIFATVPVKEGCAQKTGLPIFFIFFSSKFRWGGAAWGNLGWNYAIFWGSSLDWTGWAKSFNQRYFDFLFSALREGASTEGRPSIDRASTEGRPSIDRVSTEHRPSVDRASTECRPKVGPELCSWRGCCTHVGSAQPKIERTSTKHRPSIDRASTEHRPIECPSTVGRAASSKLHHNLDRKIGSHVLRAQPSFTGIVSNFFWSNSVPSFFRAALPHRILDRKFFTVSQQPQFSSHTASSPKLGRKIWPVLPAPLFVWPSPAPSSSRNTPL